MPLRPAWIQGYGGDVGFLAAEGSLWAARNQMAISLGWHIVLACFGVAFPAMIWVADRHGERHGSSAGRELAKRWSKVAALLFALGAVSGTVLSFEMGMLWPGLMGRFGDVLGVPFALEGIAFFVEAIFLGGYIYGWDRLSPAAHRRLLIPVASAGVVGSYCVVAVNAWMNDPTGFRLTADGSVTDVDPWAALFSRTAFWQFLHMWLAAFMVVGFIVAGVYAMGRLRGRDDEHHRLGLAIPLAFATVAALVQPVVGHVTGGRLATEQPAKLAAMELAVETESPAPLVIGGLLIDGERRFAIEIPRLGSLAATNSLDGEVPGLESIPVDERPPANVVHLAFQTMVGIGTALALFGALLWWRRRRTGDLSHRWLRGLVVAGPAAVIALEAGWVTTEVGRQPWIVHDVLRVADAATTAGWVPWSLTLVAAIYAAMTVLGVRALRSMARRWRAGDPAELPTPYGSLADRVSPVRDARPEEHVR